MTDPIEAAARAMERHMFADHELPPDPDLHAKYLDCARAAIGAYKTHEVKRMPPDPQPRAVLPPDPTQWSWHWLKCGSRDPECRRWQPALPDDIGLGWWHLPDGDIMPPEEAPLLGYVYVQPVEPPRTHAEPDEVIRLRAEVAALREAQTRAAGEIERLQFGIQAYLDGDYPNPRAHRPGKCQHGIYYYEPCENCDAAWFTALLAPTPPSPGDAP